MNQFLKLSSLCPSCGTLLSRRVSWSPRRHHTTGFDPGRVLVVHKTSRLDFERRNGNLSDNELQSKLSRIGSDYYNLVERHSVHHKSLDEILSFLQSEGVPTRVQNRESYSLSDVNWADTIFSAGGDGNFLFTASKVLTPDKLVIGLNTDPSSSEGYLCLPSCSKHSMRKTLIRIFRGEISKAQRTRVRVHIGGEVLPVRALNEVFIGEKCLSQASYYELSYDDTGPEKQKSSGVIIYTGTGSTSWAYNLNQLTVGQVEDILSLAREEGVATPTGPTEELVTKITRSYNAKNVFSGAQRKIAFVVREPIVRGLFAACKTRGYAQHVNLRSNSWHSCVIVDGHFQYAFPRGTIATCSLNNDDLLTTLDTTRTNDCFS